MGRIFDLRIGVSLLALGLLALAFDSCGWSEMTNCLWSATTAAWLQAAGVFAGIYGAAQIASRQAEREWQRRLDDDNHRLIMIAASMFYARADAIKLMRSVSLSTFQRDYDLLVRQLRLFTNLDIGHVPEPSVYMQIREVDRATGAMQLYVDALLPDLQEFLSSKEFVIANIEELVAALGRGEIETDVALRRRGSESPDIRVSSGDRTIRMCDWSEGWR